MCQVTTFEKLSENAISEPPVTPEMPFKKGKPSNPWKTKKCEKKHTFQLFRTKEGFVLLTTTTKKLVYYFQSSLFFYKIFCKSDDRFSFNHVFLNFF